MYRTLLDKFKPVKYMKPNQRHTALWTRYKSIEKAKSTRQFKMQAEVSGLEANWITYGLVMDHHMVNKTNTDAMKRSLLIALLITTPKFWNYARHFSRSNSSIDVKQWKRITDNYAKAELLNFFISVLTKKQSKWIKITVSWFEYWTHCDIKINSPIARAKLLELKAKKMSGPDSISVNVLCWYPNFDVSCTFC